ncbi:MAG TPA: hemerythrin domain-containing protein [Solirubrobacterales bacterium]|jgi:hemerythrin-like domain-containing protein
MSEEIDFTMMYVTHRALQRDVRRLSTALAEGRAQSPGVKAGWSNFKQQLHTHHTVEDEDLWPRLYGAVAERPDDLAMLEEMEAEHAVLDPLLESIETALASQDEALGTQVEDLVAALDAHFQHEEQSALPLIQSLLTPEDWAGFGNSMRRAQGLKGAAVYVPWIVDGATAEECRSFFAQLPAPVKVVNRLVLQPRYRRMGLWAS